MLSASASVLCYNPVLNNNGGFLLSGPNDWSWRIRFGSIQSLVKICRCLSSDKGREGMRTAAWNILIRAHSSEKDDRVLEALKVGQVRLFDQMVFRFLFLLCWLSTVAEAISMNITVI